MAGVGAVVALAFMAVIALHTEQQPYLTRCARDAACDRRQRHSRRDKSAAVRKIPPIRPSMETSRWNARDVEHLIETTVARAGLPADPAQRAGLERLHPIGRLGRSEEVAAAVI